jgi:hypothetical protein
MFNLIDSIINHLNELPTKPKVKLKMNSIEIEKTSNGIFRESDELNKMITEQVMTKKSKLKAPTNTAFENLIDENEGTLNDNFMPLNDTNLQGIDELAVFISVANSPSTCASVVATTERRSPNHVLEIPLYTSE